jgi:CheY-like chemotaxis protein
MAAILPLHKPRVLIVDDEPTILAALSLLLESEGFSVTVALGGEAGLSAFGQAQRDLSPYLLVLTDLAMPEVGGLEVAHAIRLAAPATRIVLLSGSTEDLTEQLAGSTDVDLVLQKPPRRVELRSALARLAGLPAALHVAVH